MSVRRLILILTILSLLLVSLIFLFYNPYSASSEGHLIVVNKGSSSISVIDLQRGKVVKEIPIEGEPHESSTVGFSGSIVLTNFGNEDVEGHTLSIIDSKNGYIEKRIDLGIGSKPHGIVTLPESEDVLVTLYLGSELLRFNVRDKAISSRIPLHQTLSNLVAVSPNGKQAYVANSNSVSVVNLESSTLVETILCGQGIEGIDVTRDGKEIWVTSILQKSIFIINSSSNKIIDTLQSSLQPTRLKFSADGKLCLVTNSEDGSLSVYDVSSRKQVKVLKLPGDASWFDRLIHHSPRPVGLLIHPNGEYAYVANSNADKIEIIDLRNLKHVCSISVGKIPDGMSILVQ